MIQQETVLEVADNSGAKTVLCIRVLGGSKRKFAYVGDLIVGVVKDTVKATASASGKTTHIKRGEIVTCVVVRLKGSTSYSEGNSVRFGDNAVVVVNKDGNPRGTRIFGPVSKRLRDKGANSKILSLAPEVV